MKLSHPLYLAILTFALMLGPATYHAQAVIINFDNLSFLDVVTTQYPEVTFSSEPGFETYVGVTTTTTSPPAFACSQVIGGGFPKCENETILNFTNPVNNLTFKSFGANSSGVIAKVDVTTPNLLITLNITGSPQLVDLSTYSDVSKIRIYDINDHLGVGWDDFTFDVVPEPASASLLAVLGLSTLTHRRRKYS